MPHNLLCYTIQLLVHCLHWKWLTKCIWHFCAFVQDCIHCWHICNEMSPVYLSFLKHRLSLVHHYTLLVLQMVIFLLEIQFHLTWHTFFWHTRNSLLSWGFMCCLLLKQYPRHSMWCVHSINCLTVYVDIIITFLYKTAIYSGDIHRTENIYTILCTWCSSFSAALVKKRFNSS